MKADTAYWSRHWRVRRDRGPAKLLLCLHCTGKGEETQARDWATIHGRDGEDIGDYIPLCRKCHVAYDGSAPPRPAVPRQRAASEKPAPVSAALLSWRKRVLMHVRS